MPLLCDVAEIAKLHCVRALAAALRWWTGGSRKMDLRAFVLAPCAQTLPTVRMHFRRPYVLTWRPKYKVVTSVGAGNAEDAEDAGDRISCRPYEEERRRYLDVRRTTAVDVDAKKNVAFPETMFARLHGPRLEVDVTDALKMVLGPRRDFHGADLSVEDLYYIFAQMYGLPSRPGEQMRITVLLARPTFARCTFAGDERLVAPQAAVIV
jgi:hypothetical protein